MLLRSLLAQIMVKFLTVLKPSRQERALQGYRMGFEEESHAKYPQSLHSRCPIHSLLITYDQMRYVDA